MEMACRRAGPEQRDPLGMTSVIRREMMVVTRVEHNELIGDVCGIRRTGDAG